MAHTLRIPSRAFWTRPSVILAFTTLAIHLFANGHYGIFRDEMYFIVCGWRPDWGYVDQPPLIPLLAATAHALFGGWLVGFRLLPALMMAATVAGIAEFTRRIGGGRFAQWLSGLCAVFAPFFLVNGLLFYTEMLQPITWLACAWLLVELEETGDERLWIPFGLIVAVSLLSKYVMAFFVVALALGMLATPLRRSLGRPWLYVGALLGIVLVLPNVLWQYMHGWPFLELAARAGTGKNVELSPLSFFAMQAVLMGPLSVPVWMAGLWGCMRKPTRAIFPAFFIAYLLLFVFFDVTHSKVYFLISFYPILLAIGAVRWEIWLSNRVQRSVAAALIVTAGIIAMPLAVPVLSEETYIRYADALGMGPSAAAMENHQMGRLPQIYADMHGWPEMASKVAKVYWALPPQDRKQAVFYSNNTGEASAIDVFGRRLGLPPAISGHNNYWIWGPRGHDGSVVIVIGGDRRKYEKLFRSVEVAGRTDAPYAMPYENNQPIYVLRGLRIPLSRYWESVKIFS